MKQIHRHAITIIVFSIITMSNRIIAMNTGSQKLDIKPITSQNREQTKTYLNNYFNNHQNRLLNIQLGSICNLPFLLLCTTEYNQNRTVNQLLNDKNNFNILNKSTQKIIGFANISYETRLSLYGRFTSSKIKNLILINNTTKKRNALQALVRILFDNTNIDMIEHPEVPGQSEFLTINGFTPVALDSKSFSLLHYELSRERYNSRVNQNQ